MLDDKFLFRRLYKTTDEFLLKGTGTLYPWRAFPCPSPFIAGKTALREKNAFLLQMAAQGRYLITSLF